MDADIKCISFLIYIDEFRTLPGESRDAFDVRESPRDIKKKNSCISLTFSYKHD